MALLLFGLVLAASLILIPLGLPGTWVMLGAAIGYNVLVGGDPIGWVTLVGATVLAVIAEIAEFMLGGRFARRYGGSRRSGWGAIVGGLVGAFAGVPVPIVGPLIGALAGSFLGALVFEYSVARSGSSATRVATGALIGRVTAIALKSAVGCVLIAWLVLAAWV